MYWICFAIFVVIVFIPKIVQQGLYGFDLAETQEFAILLLGAMGLFVSFIQQKSLRKKLAEKKDIQKQANQMTKDLTSSYSYIGETNRKIDILEQVALSFPESTDLTIKKQKRMYDSIMEAIRLLGKSDEFILRFICLKEKDVLKEIKSLQELAFNFSCKILNSSSQFFESDEFIMITSPKAIDNIVSCIIIRKKNPNQKIEDLEILKTIASQALFFFMFIKQKKRIACTN